ncbi:MAG: hypothetical protein HOV80_38810 [Polyangiaceae bacterium]|nr:hypothetical protein [Polyangiaceae bacterium]
MDALELLRSQHAAIARVLDSAGESGDPDHLLQELAHLLLGHMVIEEHFFYPRMAELEKSEDRLAESYEEHMIARFALGRAMVGGADARARLSVLKDLVLHHIQEEERDLFVRAKRLMSAAQLRELGERMQSEFERVQTSDFDEVLESDGSLALKHVPQAPQAEGSSPRRKHGGPPRRAAAR